MRNAAVNSEVKSLCAEIEKLLNKPLYFMTGDTKDYFWLTYNTTTKTNPTWNEMRIGFENLGYDGTNSFPTNTDETIKLLKSTKGILIEKISHEKKLKQAVKDFSKVNSTVNPSNDI